MYLFIDGIDRTGNYIRNSIVIKDELQERVNSCNFRCSGFTPVGGERVEVYSAYPILSSTSNSVTLDKKYNVAVQNNLFRVGGKITVAINLDDQEDVIIESIKSNSDNIKLTFTENFVNQPVLGELVGIKIFGGSVVTPDDYNIGTLKNLEHRVTCLDHQKIFDKATVNDTYVSRDGRYIINDFCNVVINKNQLIDSFEYESDGAIQAVWTKGGSADDPLTDSSNFREGDYSGKFPWTFSSGSAYITQSDGVDSVGIGTPAGPGPIKAGQTFTSTTATSISKITLKLRKSGTPTDNIVVNVYESDKSTLLATSNIDGSTLTSTAADYDFNFSTSIDINATTEYFIEVERDGSLDGSNYYNVSYSSADVYAGGTRWAYSTSWVAQTKDLYFILESEASTSFESSELFGDISDFIGVTSGQPTKGVLGLWMKPDDFSLITSIELRIGSDSSNYASETINFSENSWAFIDLKLKNSSVTGTPDWQNVDYFEFVITQTADSFINVDGIRILEEQFFRHYPFVEETSIFDNFKVSRVKPTETVQRIADEIGWYWYIDYDRNIKLFPEESNEAPIQLNETSDNFTNLSIKSDLSRLTNKQVVEGGTETSVSFYSEVNEGDAVKREWIAKNKFKNLSVKLDDGSVTDLMEAGTTTTNIEATAHGLSTGDYITNRSRSNAVRKITKVDDDNFSVDEVLSQASGDSFSIFVNQNVGVEGINADTGNDFMSNFNEKSIRNAEDQATLESGDFLLFSYNEVVPILVSRTDAASITNMVNVLGYSDGVFEGQKIVDKTLTSRSEAVAVAEAQLNKYSNIIISAKFNTTQEGLRSGQLILIKDTDNGTRNINQSFLIQKVSIKQKEWGENEYVVSCSSLLFGMLELLQQLLRQGRKLDVSEDEVVNNIVGASEKVLTSDILLINNNLNQFVETLTISDTLNLSVIEPPFQWGPGGANPGKWNLFSW